MLEEQGERNEIISGDGDDKTLEGGVEVYDSLDHVNRRKEICGLVTDTRCRFCSGNVYRTLSGTCSSIFVSW